MASFRTELTFTPSRPIDHTQSIITTGSCFSDNIGVKLFDHKFPTIINPLGTTYNPVSIHDSLKLLPDSISSNSFVETSGAWQHLDFHSKFGSDTRSALEENLKGSIATLNESLSKASVLIITYGTAWVYVYQQDNHVVSNCHKLPSKNFYKRLLTKEEIVSSFESLYKHLKSINPGLRIILTLSPVRHVKDTLELNQVSKSAVRLAIHEVVRQFSDVEYFPAYEIVLDDLRDYRFFEADMIHPNDVAVDYIWNKFGETYFSVATRDLNERWEKLKRSMEHRPFQPHSDQHQKFLRSILDDLLELNGKIDVTKELTDIRHRVQS